MSLPVLFDSGARSVLQWSRDLIMELEVRFKSQGGTGSGSGAGTLALPPGVFFPFGGSDAPAGFLLCEGQLIADADQPNLSRVLGRKYCLGGDATGFFRLPNGAGKVFLGQVGGVYSGGNSAVVLTQGNLPNVSLTVTDPGHTHTHTQSAHTHTVTDPTHTHSASGSPIIGSSTVNVAAGSVTIPTGSVGSVTPALAATGVTVNAATSTGSNATHTTGVSVALGGSATPVDLTPEFFAGSWIVSL
jgi:microcystin-dependent protein